MSRGQYKNPPTEPPVHCPDCGRASLSPSDELAQVKALVEEARAAKLAADGQDWPPKGIAYEDLPPLHPDDADMLREKLLAILDRAAGHHAGEISGGDDEPA
ncbi:hypothetical protein [Robiginitomaculum antarcticum]|uniref:hypothetical protein n=1 Tax=Robiginitomaculum antarcticum TaxID=437507 RepID=UPI00036EB024|nr:hypothetical protein [Robiginitomaculum antarcticum]